MTKGNKSNGKLRVSSRVEKWTAQKARKQLQENPRNRNLNENWILDLAQAIENGEWEMNGETIKINCNGEIEDGQHRLEAVALAGIPVEILTVRGLSVSAFDTIDQGKKRSMGHVMQKHHEKNANLLASSVTNLWRYENNTYEATGVQGIVRAPQALGLLSRNPELRDSVDLISNLKQLRSVINGSVATFCHYIMSRRDKIAADDFFVALSSGENLTKSKPVYRLREKLINNRLSDRVKRFGRVESTALVIKAWNFTREGVSIRSLTWRSNEEFPDIV